MKTTRKIIHVCTLALLLVLLMSTDAPASDTRSRPEGPWSFSTSLTYPIVRIYSVHINYRLDTAWEIFLGPGFQNFSHDSFVANAYTLILGYRRFVWKQAFLEFELYPAYNPIYSKIEKRHYPGVELWTEIKAGYRFVLPGGRLYLQPSPGIGFGIFRTNPPPNFRDEIETPIFIPQLQVGMRI